MLSFIKFGSIRLHILDEFVNVDNVTTIVFDLAFTDIVSNERAGYVCVLCDTRLSAVIVVL